MSAERPPHQRWIKRPPKPSRAAPPKPVMRERPGAMQLFMAVGFAISAGIVGAILGPMLVDRPGMGGLFAGVGFAVAFLTMWKGFGGTLADIRAVFR